jgi:chromate transporter
MQALFYAVGAAVIGIIAVSAFRLTRTLGKAPLLWLVYLVAAVATAVTETEDVRLILAAGVLVWLVRAPRPTWLRGAPGLLFAPIGGRPGPGAARTDRRVLHLRRGGDTASTRAWRHS